MPPRPLKVCRHAGCHELTRDPSGYCPKHKEAAEVRARKWKAEQDSQRESAYRRGYGARWRKLRAQVLMEEPLCRECRKAGRIVPATDVDHIVARADGGTDGHGKHRICGMIRNMMLGMGKNFRYGEIIYDTNGTPAAMIAGSYASNGKEPWNIRGRRVWIAVALASKRAYNKKWCSESPSCSTDISSIENPVITFKLANSNTRADGSGNFVSVQSAETHMDQSFTYKYAIKNSKELTDAILAYNSGMQVAQFCRTITLAGFGKMDLPSIDVLMRIYQARTMIDALDPTASANAEMKLSNWGFK